jgi:hypothetical protein
MDAIFPQDSHDQTRTTIHSLNVYPRIVWGCCNSLDEILCITHMGCKAGSKGDLAVTGSGNRDDLREIPVSSDTKHNDISSDQDD